MAKFAEVSPEGIVTAFYDDAVHDTVPAEAIQIPEADWQAHLSGDLRRWDGSAWVPFSPPPPPPEEVERQIIAGAEARIDAIADEVYTRSVSRGARYRQKLDEARRYVAAGYPGTVAEAEYPYLVREAPVRGMTKRQLADVIIAAAAAYDDFGSLAETARARLKTEVPAAADEAAKRAAADAIVAEVQTAAQALQQ